MKKVTLFLFLLLLSFAGLTVNGQPSKQFKAGAAKSNITPSIGTSINGSFNSNSVKDVHDETYARCIVLDDGDKRLAFVVADLCVIGENEVDIAKLKANKFTDIPVENILVSATHTHSGGTACSVFQNDPDSAYLSFLSERIGDAIIRANNNLEPARVGWAIGSEPNEVFNRRWKMKPGTPMVNPFGENDKVVMNPGVANPALLEPAGPVDPQVYVLSIQSSDGKPLALLANYSLHYVGGVGSGAVSADYFGMFAKRVEELLGQTKSNSEFIAIMSNGTSGDINNINWGGEKTNPLAPYFKMKQVADRIADVAINSIQGLKYQEWVRLGSEQEQLVLKVRKPSSSEVKRANEIISKAEGPQMKTRDEVYARETVLINKYPDQVTILLQSLNIGDLVINAIPAEVFVEIGLELKQKSPFKSTFNISLANGYYGYLPTPAHHKLGGYETWRARSSFLEVDASTKITSVLFRLMNKLKQQGNN